MQTVHVNGVDIGYEDVGSGEPVVFSHSYLLDYTHFTPQIEHLKKKYRCIAFDHRGHGGSERITRAYTMEDLYQDAVAFLEQVVGGPCHFVGLSTGGYVGVRLAYRRPDLLKSVVLMDTTADAEEPGPLFQYRVLLFLAHFLGRRFIAKMAFPYLFGRTFRRDPQRSAESASFLEQMAANDVAAMIAFGKAIFVRDSVYSEMRTVATPTLVVVGQEDVSTPVKYAQRLADAIPGADLVEIPQAGHICTIEQPELVNETLADFLSKHQGS